MRLSRTLPWLALPLLSLACAPGDAGAPPGRGEAPRACAEAPAPPAEGEPGGVHGFASEGELAAHLGALEARLPALGCPELPARAAPAAFGGARAGGEAGVEEGDIVKAVDNYLVVLRRGRLHVIEAAAGAPGRLVDAAPVAPAGAPGGEAWYDEVLVRGDLVYVIGYRRGVEAAGASTPGATEIRSFRLAGGRLERLRSTSLESYDYFSGAASATRLVGDRLVFFTRYPLRWGADGAPAYPRALAAGAGGEPVAAGPLFGTADVVSAVTKPASAPIFYTVMRCDLPPSGALDCRARSLVGAGARVTYASAGAFYLWADAHVYRFDLASLEVTAHQVRGEPVDAFALRERGGELVAAANRAPRGVGVEALRLPLADFDKAGLRAASATPLDGARSAYESRFVGDGLVVALAAGGEGAANPADELVALDLATGATGRAPTDFVERLEPLDENRVLVVSAARGEGGRPEGVEVRALALADLGRPLAAPQRLAGLAVGEGRSHAFVYRPEGGGAGAFGLALTDDPSRTAARGFGQAASGLGFFDVSAGGEVTSLGVVSPARAETACGAACVDWYGNTRPVFVGERAYALMGDELAPLSLRPGLRREGDALALDAAAP